MALVLVEGPTDGVVVFTLNRPERRNALSGELVAAWQDALHAAEADPEVRVAVLTGAGKAFCAGGDLTGGMQGAGGVVPAHLERARFGEVLGDMARSRLPIVAAVNGDALGGGLGLAAACDLVVADETARFGTPEIRLGLFPWVILAVLQRNVGRKDLMEMVLTGDKIDAAAARERGLVNRVVDAGTCLAEATALATTIASRAPLSLAMGKAAFHAVADQSFDDALRYLNTQLTLNLMTQDALEGVAAFLQKRDPSWKGA